MYVRNQWTGLPTSELENIATERRKIYNTKKIQKILGTKKNGEGLRNRINKELYQETESVHILSGQFGPDESKDINK